MKHAYDSVCQHVRRCMVQFRTNSCILILEHAVSIISRGRMKHDLLVTEGLHGVHFLCGGSDVLILGVLAIVTDS